MTDQLSRTLAAAGIPPRFADRRLDTFTPSRITGGQRALDACRALVEKPAGLVLTGPTGVGKTHLYAGVVAARAEAWLARYPEAVRETGAGMAPRPESELPGPLGVAGQPILPQPSGGFNSYPDPRAGLPRMSEGELIGAHRGCVCRTERVPWESWSPGQWAWHRRRQRVMAQRAAQREARRERTGAA